MTIKQSNQIVETIFDNIIKALSKGENVKITRFGNFIVRNKRSRKGRNPKTGKHLEISARKIVVFKPSDILKERIKLS